MCPDEVLVGRPPPHPCLMGHAPSKVLIQLSWRRPTAGERGEAEEMGTIYCLSERNGASDLSHSFLER